MSPRRYGSKKSISYLMPIFVIGAIIIIVIAGYYVAATLPGSLPTQISSTLTTQSTSSSYAYSPYSTSTLSYTFVGIMNGASQGKVESFNPQNVTVVIGVNNTVVWQNFDTVNQTIADSGSLFTHTLLSGQRWNFTYTAAGTYPYSSPIYPWENGTVTVVS